MTAPVTSVDLAAYRVVFAVYSLLCLPSFTFVADYPDTAFTAPPGPFAVLDGFPDVWVMRGLEMVLALSLAALLVGYRVGLASILTTATMIIGYGLTFSLGKIDHNILVVLTPVVLAAAGWAGGSAARGWVLRLWAIAIGLAMLSAGLGKFLGGWLDPTTHATRGYVGLYEGQLERSGVLGSLAFQTDSAWLWEPMDVAAVLIECALVVAVVSWAWFRRATAVLCLFHLGVALLLGILFAGNVIVYAAFVPWSRVLPKLAVPARGWLVVPVGAAAWSLTRVVTPDPLVYWVVVIAGAMVATWHLTSDVTRALPQRSSTERRGSALTGTRQTG